MSLNNVLIHQVPCQLKADYVVVDELLGPTIFSIGNPSDEFFNNLLAYTLRISLTEAGDPDNLLLPGQNLNISDAFALGDPTPALNLGIATTFVRDFYSQDFYERIPDDVSKIESFELAKSKNKEVQFAVGLTSGKIAIREFLFTGVFEHEA